MVLLGNVRTTPDAAMCRSTSSGSAKPDDAVVSGMPSNRSTRPGQLIVLADVLDDLAVVGQVARGAEGDLAAQLGDLANRRDDRLGVRRSVAGHLHEERHAVVAVGVVDHQPGARHLGVALDDRRYL